MPLKNTGNVITRIRVCKNKVSVFFGKDKIDISHSAFTCDYLYEGKELSEKDIRHLKDITDSETYTSYAMGLLSKGRYTEWKMRQKIYARGAEQDTVNLVIQSLKKAGLIDDSSFIRDFVLLEEEKKYGKNRILRDLRAKGVFDENLKGLKFPAANEKRKARENLAKLEKKYAKYPEEQKKQHIYGALLTLGFDNDTAIGALSAVRPGNEKEEREKLDADLSKTYRRLSSKHEGRELKEKVITSLRSHGYRLGNIVEAWEENGYEND